MIEANGWDNHEDTFEETIRRELLAAQQTMYILKEDNKELTKVSISNYTKEHPRCGTSFILIVVMVSIIVFMFFPRENIILFIISRIVLVPVIAGISYELLKFGSKSKFKIFKTRA